MYRNTLKVDPLSSYKRTLTYKEIAERETFLKQRDQHDKATMVFLPYSETGTARPFPSPPAQYAQHIRPLVLELLPRPVYDFDPVMWKKNERTWNRYQHNASLSFRQKHENLEWSVTWRIFVRLGFVALDWLE